MYNNKGIISKHLNTVVIHDIIRKISFYEKNIKNFKATWGNDLSAVKTPLSNKPTITCDPSSRSTACGETQSLFRCLL